MELMTKQIRHWYNVLQRDGFEDVERVSHHELHLKRWSSNFRTEFCSKEPYHFYVKQDYYYYARHFAEEYEFDSGLHRYIWFLHAEGVSMRDIAKTIRNNYMYNGTRFPGISRPNKDNINTILKRLKKIFLEYWKRQVEDNFNDILQNC